MNSKFTLQSTKRIFRFAIRFPGFFFGLFGGDETAGHRIREVLKMGDLRLRWSVFFREPDLPSRKFRESEPIRKFASNRLRFVTHLGLWGSFSSLPPDAPLLRWCVWYYFPPVYFFLCKLTEIHHVNRSSIQDQLALCDSKNRPLFFSLPSFRFLALRIGPYLVLAVFFLLGCSCPTRWPKLSSQMTSVGNSLLVCFPLLAAATKHQDFTQSGTRSKAEYEKC